MTPLSDLVVENENKITLIIKSIHTIMNDAKHLVYL